MAQVSRPFQIALGAVVVLALVWMVALRSHLSKPGEPAPSSPAVSAPAPTAASEAKAAAAPTPVYHGAAPGVEGLTRAIAKAHEAVATSQRNAQQLQGKSAAASGESKASSAATPKALTATGATAATQRAAEAAALARRAVARAHIHSSKAHGARGATQIALEREIARGKTVMIVFWNPRSTVDQEVRAQAGALVAGSKGAVTLHAALARQVGIFAPITEVVRVYQTPTILIVNRHGLVSTLTGLTDVFALEQAVREARRANR
jgi:hypothetical protein